MQVAVYNFLFLIFSSKIRVVTIDGIDSEGCGGTHLDSTGSIGFIKIIRTETVQEGIQRIIFSAGPAAMRYVQTIYDTVVMEQEFMKVDIKDVYSRSLEIFREDLENQKLIDRYRKEKIESVIMGNSTKIGNIAIYTTNFDREDMNLLIQAIFRQNTKAVVINSGTEMTGIGIDSYVDTLVSGLLKEGIKVEEKIRNKKLYSATCSKGVSEKLIREILEYGNI